LALVAERERGVTGPASQAWADLHAKGYPSSSSIASQADVDSQATARNEQQWNSYIGALKQHFPLSPEQETEIRGGVVNEGVHAWAQDEKARLIKDKGFYRRLLDGDRAAKREWGLVTAILSLRPVPRATHPGRK
jgi:hypothetical protein